MAGEIAIYLIPGHKRSGLCCHAMYAGIRAMGHRARLLPETAYQGPEHDVAVFYGYTATLRRVMADYRASGRKAVYIDLGYWGREGQRGYHKVVVNARHPTEYFQNRKHDDSRLGRFGLSPKRWREGRHILLAGMGDKAAGAEGFRVEAFERDAIAALRHVTDRPIIYRPKPSWLMAQPIDGTIYSPKSHDLNAIMAGAHAVVTHHSNVAVEGLIAGVPAFCWKGVATPLALQDLARIEVPLYPDGREQWAADVAWTQWSIDEMDRGLAWRYLKDEGLVP